MRKESVLCKYWNNDNRGNIENNKFNGCFSVCFDNGVMGNWCLIVGMGGYVQATPGVDKPYGTPPPLIPNNTRSLRLHSLSQQYKFWQ